MVHKEYTWESNDDVKLYGQSWMPDDHPRAVINYVHGFKDHSSRFEKWARRFVDYGVGVIAIDLRGHGRSEGRRGYAAKFDCYLKDIQILCTNSYKLFPGSPQVLYGHSLGGNLVVNYLIGKTPLPHAAVITSPWFTLAHKPSMAKQTMGKLVRTILPGMLIRSDLDSSALSRDKEVVSQYNSDPLVHHSILPRLFFEIESNGKNSSRSIYKINIPLLVMHGSDDRITSVKMTRDFVMNAGRGTTYKEWAGGYHELHLDIIEQEVFDFLLDWLNKKVISIS